MREITRNTWYKNLTVFGCIARAVAFKEHHGTNATATNTTRRPQAGYSGLVRPTPVRQIVTSTSNHNDDNVRQPPLSSSNVAVKSSLGTARTSHSGSSSQLRHPSIINSSNNINNPASRRPPSQVLSGSHSKLSQLRPRAATSLVPHKINTQYDNCSVLKLLLFFLDLEHNRHVCSYPPC